MSVLRCLLVAAALVGLARATHAQESAPMAFERATEVEAALPQSSVYQILEDRRGFLWFATREGLARWDGTTMRTWRRDPFRAASLPGNIVRQLVEDGSRDLWVRAEATDWAPMGIARLVGPSHEEVRRYGHVGAEVFIGPDDTPWLADSTHLWRYHRDLDRFDRVRPRIHQAQPTAELVTTDGTLWLASVDGLEAYPLEGPARKVGINPDVLVDPSNAADNSALAEGPDGTIWIGGTYLGHLDPSRRTFKRLDLEEPEIHNYGRGFGAGTLIPDADGLWMATLDGVYRYTFASSTLTRHSLRLPGDIETQNWVTGLHRDRAGTVWAGTVWGLHRASPRASPFHLLAHNPDDPSSLSSGIILSITRDTRGALWVGTLGGGLNRMGPDGNTTRYRHVPDDPTTLAHDWVWSLAADDETLWIGTGNGLNAIDLDAPGSVRRYAPPEGNSDPFGPSAAGLRLDADGTLWFGHVGGLHRRTRDGQVRVAALSGGIQDVNIIPGGAWVTTGDGLFRYDDAEDAFQRYTHDPNDPTSLSDDATMALHLDRQGRLWVGTQSGLDRYDPATDGFTHFTTEDGLPSSAVYAILEDDQERLWMSTNRGLARYDETSSVRIRAYTVDDGVGNVEFNRHAAWKDADGTMYFGGDRGVTVFHPDDLTTPARRSPVVITALHRSTLDTTVTTTYVGLDGIELAPDVTTFGFEFAALEFINAHRMRYAVRMDGWDEGWVEIGRRQEMTYTNLPPGQYTFRVRAANADGVWGEASATIPVVVRPWFWQTAWFRALAVLALVGIVALVVWDVSRRRYRRQLARLEAQRALDAERARISRDMHDEVGASLSEIAVLSEVARRQLADSDRGTASPADERLRRIADTSRAMLESLGQIVWAINPRNDTLTALVGTLREHAARTLEAHQLDEQLRFPREVPEHPVSAEVRRAVFLIQKEALHNVVKHAQAQTVEIELAIEPNGLTLIIADDGCGFAPHSGDGAPTAFGGNGLANMERRAEEIGGHLSIEGTPGGARITLTAPFTLHKSPVDVTRDRHQLV